MDSEVAVESFEAVDGLLQSTWVSAQAQGGSCYGAMEKMGKTW